MAHRFKVGELVKYKPIGAKVSLYKILRHLPEEFPATDWKYRIKSAQEGFERTVLECALSVDRAGDVGRPGHALATGR